MIESFKTFLKPRFHG